MRRKKTLIRYLFGIATVMAISACTPKPQEIAELPTLVSFPTETASFTPTDTDIPTETPIPSATPTFTETASPTNTEILTATIAASATSTSTYAPSPTITNTFVPSATFTLVPTATLQPSPLPSGETYYANNGDVSVRSCSQRDCQRLGVLQFGESIQVLQSVTGDSVGSSTRWYEVIYAGQIGYVHSSLLSSTVPRPTSIPSSSSSSGGQSSSGQQWSCSGNIYNCGDFGSSCANVMSYFNTCPGDPSDLDGDHDGIPCESICGG